MIGHSRRAGELLDYLFNETHSHTSPIPAYQNKNAETLFLGTRNSPDLAIEVPDFDVAAVRKLARGLQRLRVRIGLDRLLRGKALVVVYLVRPIGRHDVLPPPRQRRENGARAHGAMREPGEPIFQALETGGNY